MAAPTVIDFHSHILPALDHGCSDMEQCRKQLSLMKASGTDMAVATSHFYPHEHEADRFIAKVDAAIEQMKQSGITDAPSIAVGAEVLLCRNLHKMQGFSELCIRGTRVLLLELPLNPLKDAHFDTVETIINNGYTVVLAHIDRYLKKFGDEVDTFLSMGALAQINAYSLASGSTKKKILSYLETTDKICAIGSDLHGADEANYKKFVKAQKILKDFYPSIMARSRSLLGEAETVKFN